MTKKYLVFSFIFITSILGIIAAKYAIPTGAYFDSSWKNLVLSAKTSQVDLKIKQYLWQGPSKQEINRVEWQKIMPGDQSTVSFQFVSTDATPWICGRYSIESESKVTEQIYTFAWLDRNIDGIRQEDEPEIISNSNLDKTDGQKQFAIADSTSQPQLFSDIEYFSQVFCFGDLTVSATGFECSINPEVDYNLFKESDFSIDWKFKATQASNNQGYRCN